MADRIQPKVRRHSRVACVLNGGAAIQADGGRGVDPKIDERRVLHHVPEHQHRRRAGTGNVRCKRTVRAKPILDRRRASHDHRTIERHMEFDDLAPHVGVLAVNGLRWIDRHEAGAAATGAAAMADDLCRVERAAGHLVGGAVGDGAVADRQHGVDVAPAIVDGRAVQGERPGADADAVQVDVRLHHRVAEHQPRRGAQLASVDRLADDAADVQRQLRQAHHMDAPGEQQRDVDVLAALVGVADRAVEGDALDARRTLAAVHPVAAAVAESAAEGQPRARRAAAQADAAAVQGEGARGNADAVRVRIAGHHRVAEGERPRARARGVAGLADPRADAEREQRRAGDRGGLVEAQPHFDGLADAVAGGVRRRADDGDADLGRAAGLVDGGHGHVDVGEGVVGGVGGRRVQADVPVLVAVGERIVDAGGGDRPVAAPVALGEGEGGRRHRAFRGVRAGDRDRHVGAGPGAQPHREPRLGAFLRGRTRDIADHQRGIVRMHPDETGVLIVAVVRDPVLDEETDLLVGGERAGVAQTQVHARTGGGIDVGDAQRAGARGRPVQQNVSVRSGSASVIPEPADPDRGVVQAALEQRVGAVDVRLGRGRQRTRSEQQRDDRVDDAGARGAQHTPDPLIGGGGGGGSRGGGD